jgi:hypothetical protein
LFHNATIFGSCIIHILHTGCANIKKKNSGANGLRGMVVSEIWPAKQNLIWACKDVMFPGLIPAALHIDGN